MGKNAQQLREKCEAAATRIFEKQTTTEGDDTALPDGPGLTTASAEERLLRQHRIEDRIAELMRMHEPELMKQKREETAAKCLQARAKRTEAEEMATAAWREATTAARLDEEEQRHEAAVQTFLTRNTGSFQREMRRTRREGRNLKADAMAAEHRRRRYAETRASLA